LRLGRTQLLLVPVLLASLSLVARAEPRHAEWVRKYEPYLPGTEPTDEENGNIVVSVRLVRDSPRGFVPVPGATVRHYAACDILGPKLLVSATADEFGFANLVRPEPEGAHWLFEARGLGVVHEFEFFKAFNDAQVVLPTAISRRIRIVDLDGCPNAGAPFELYLGCPHSPAVRTGTTDEDGVALLEGLGSPTDGHLWVRAEGILFGRYELPYGRYVGQSLPTVVVEPALSARGVVLSQDGEPVPGVVVREDSNMRGPVTKTDAEGRFVLPSLRRGEGFEFYAPDRPFGSRPNATVRNFDPGVPLRMMLRDDRPTVHGESEVLHALDVVLVRPDPDSPSPQGDEVPLRATRLADGFTTLAVSVQYEIIRGYEPGPVSLTLPPGTYRITAGGEYSRWKTVETTVTLQGEGKHGAQIRLAVRQQIPLTPEQQKEASWARAPHHVIRFRLRGPDGEILPPSWAELHVFYGDLPPEVTEDGWCAVRTRASGPATLRIGRPEYGLIRAALEIPVELPADKPREISLGEIAVPRPNLEAEEPIRRSLLILRPDGERFRPRAVRVGSSGLEDYGAASDRHGRVSWAQDAAPIEAQVTIDDPLNGVSIEWYPLNITLASNSPKEVRFPAERLTLCVRGEDGEPLATVLYVNMWRYELDDGRIDLRGMPPGPHTLILGATGHLGEARRVVLKEGEHRQVTCTLQRRPK
jgi:hypothetical protein